jgi:transposase
LCVDEVRLDILIVADKGFCSEQNLDKFDKHDLQYIIPLRRNRSSVDYAPLKRGDFKASKQFFIYQKRIIWYFEYWRDERKYVTFLDEQLRVQEEQDFLARNEDDLKKYTGE